ncbi:4'-phosphopantetheinyl transferase family protein [Lutimonas zeaxanthinifaciens]|uniref:4'-phosphopantetheinyl transferase family protein n=1 Tax=Lutimonas zeaxanthinifaciens TaxID=3060215 RepID=UPI00265D5514|nr:4'-phosphopantetheinyl transferase superfamily protein [Lutimonas sp. YSD2104]WKK64898.1 4'-phosphopantetheinyl transferase superfamily protein [Lutimonas sp. YSD2104]
MIGTDIIDLKEARLKSDWRRKGYLGKLFSKTENEFIESSEDQEIAVWRLWSMKESAYKADYHHTRERKFNPFKIQCDIQNPNTGLVCIDSRIYHTYSLITKEFVLTWTTKNNGHTFCKALRTGVHEVDAISHLLYLKLRNELANKFGMDPEDISIHKNGGAPEVFLRGHMAGVYCSISHHGKFGSLLFCC